MRNKALERGIIVVDKPAGMTSHDVVQEVKKILKVEKAGHSGTLDSKVTGVLLIALNEAVKAMPVLMGLDKEYSGVIYLHNDTGINEVKAMFRKFTGKITQIPPVKSRVVRKPRERNVYSFQLLKKSGKSVFFKVHCQSGLYVRKLIHDMGEELGAGAHMKELRRLSVNVFSEKEAKTLHEIKNGNYRVIPLEKALDRIGLKRIYIHEKAINKALNGNPIMSGDIKSKDRRLEIGEIAGLYHENKIIALCRFSGSKVRIDRVFQSVSNYSPR